mgnify:CR=1 FL=1
MRAFPVRGVKKALLKWQSAMEKIKGGYAAVARKLLTSEVMLWSPVWFKLWVWLIVKANHKTVRKGGVVYHRGEVLTSYSEMRNACAYKIGYRLEKPSKSAIRDFCEATTKARMIATTKTTRGFWIKIDKYDYFQNPSNYEAHNESHNKRTISAQRGHTVNKNEKNEKNENIREKTSGDSPQTPFLPKGLQQQNTSNFLNDFTGSLEDWNRLMAWSDRAHLKLDQERKR